MKKIYIALLTLTGLITSYSFINRQGDPDVTMPDWTWTSGEVQSGVPADKQAFALSFTQAFFKAGDKVRITFNSYKVTLGGLTKGTTFSKWSCKVKLLYNDGGKWVPLVADSTDVMNKRFSNVNNNPAEELKDCSFVATLPADRILHITVEPDKWDFDHIDGHNKPMFTHGRPMFSVSINGYQVEKQ